MRWIGLCCRVALAGCVALAVSVGPATPTAGAAEKTDLLGDWYSRDRVGFHVELGWDFYSKSGLIRREFRCLSHDEASGQYCPNGSKVIDRNELKTERTVHHFNVEAAVAFFDLAQLSITIPIVLTDQTELSYDDGVDPFNTSVDPDNRPSLFPVPYVGFDRAGVGDPTISLRFTPISYARDDTRPTWAVGLDVTVPAVERKRAGNEAVGDGLWEVKLWTAISSRFTQWVEPYFGISGTFNLTGKSLFKNLGNTQTLTSPGHRLGILFGTEFIPWEDPEAQRFFVVDLGASIDFHFEGRDYTDLFEALGNSPCNPRDQTDPCSLTSFYPGASGDLRQTDGITDYEQYAVIKGWFGIRIQPVKYFQIKASGFIGHETSHFITTADAGKDLDNVNQVDKPNEYNPVYNPAYDALGTRFRTANTLLFGAMVSVLGKY